MKDYRSFVLRSIPDEKIRHTLDEIMRPFQQDSNLWLDAALRLGHQNYMINALQDSKNGMESDREEFKNMLVEFMEYAQEAAKNISSSTISSSINKQIEEYVGAPTQEVCAITLAEYRTARETEMVWTAQKLRRTNTTLIICAIMCIVCLVGGYSWGAASAKKDQRLSASYPTEKSSPYVAVVEDKPRQQPQPQQQIPKRKSSKYLASQDGDRSVDYVGTLNADVSKVGDKGDRISITKIILTSECENNTAYKIGALYVCSQFVDFK